MKPPISKDTQLCMSLSGRPGNFGTRFHNHLYDALGLDFLYKAFTTTDLPAAIAGIRALGIRGCAVSMPFKEACIPYLDQLDASASVLQSVNTIVNEGGALHAYNTDYLAVRQVLTRHQVDPALRFVLRGSGGMARAVAFALRDAGFNTERFWPATRRRGGRWPTIWRVSAAVSSGSPNSGNPGPKKPNC